jgi:Photosynthetic reaction centre cytochrome C subunit
LKTSSLSLPAAAVAMLTAVLFTVSAVAQAPQDSSPQPGGPPPGARNFPAPTNLKVLPKDLTGQQVREIMENWQGQLGVRCGTCHAADPKNLGPNGRPRINFADDSKEEKNTARLMAQMTENINKNYLAKLPNADTTVTCGTCHRGHLSPERFVVPAEEHDGPRAPQGEPPAGAKPSAQN